MGNPKFLKVGRLGEGAKEMAVEDDWTIAQLKEECDFEDHDGQAFGLKGTVRTPLDDDDLINGYDSVLFANKVKGGNQ